jgi:preprotein translocase subunit SecA
MMADLATEILDSCAPETQKPDEWDKNSLNIRLQKQFGVQIDFSSLPRLDSESLEQVVTHLVKDAYENQKRNLGNYLEAVQKMVLLQTIDQKWKDHLKTIDRLKEGINLRGYAQRDPIIEYKREAFVAFEQLLQSIKSEVVEKFLKIQIVTPEQDAVLDLRMKEQELNRLRYEGAREADAGGGSFSSQPRGGQSQLAQTPVRGFPKRGPDQGPKMNRAQRREMEKRRR